MDGIEKNKKKQNIRLKQQRHHKNNECLDSKEVHLLENENGLKKHSEQNISLHKVDSK